MPVVRADCGRWVQKEWSGTPESSPYRATEKPSPYWMKVKNPRYSHAKDAKTCSSEPDCPQQVCSVDLSAVLSRSSPPSNGMEIILILFAIAGGLFGLWMMLPAIYRLLRH